VASCFIGIGCGNGDERPATETGANYESLLAAAKASPETADFAKLRMVWTETDRYDPDMPAKLKTPAILDSLLLLNDRQLLLDSSLALLETCYLNIEAHGMAALIQSERGNTERFRHHQLWFVGLIQSITGSGDGLSPGTAFQVIDAQEENAIVEFYRQTNNIQFGEQMSETIDGHHYHIYDATYPNGQEVQIHFDVDIPMAAG